MTTQTLWDLVIAATIVLYAASALIGIRQFIRWCNTTVDRHVQTALTDTDNEWDAWVDEALQMSETPIYDATIQYIAKRATDDIDREWLELSGGAM